MSSLEVVERILLIVRQSVKDKGNKNAISNAESVTRSWKNQLSHGISGHAFLLNIICVPR